MGYKKCDFSKMGSRVLPRHTKSKMTEKILKDRDKRRKEWQKWLTQ